MSFSALVAGCVQKLRDMDLSSANLLKPFKTVNWRHPLTARAARKKEMGLAQEDAQIACCRFESIESKYRTYSYLGDLAKLGALIRHEDRVGARGQGREHALINAFAGNVGRELDAKTISTIKFLLAHCDPDFRDPYTDSGDTFIMELCRDGRGHSQVVSLLLNEGFCDLDAINNRGETLTMLAAEIPWPQPLKTIATPQRCQAFDHAGQTALMKAVRKNQAKHVALLVSMSDVNARDKQGNTALMLAAASNQVECIQLLAPLSDVGARNHAGLNAVELAKSRGHCAPAFLISAAERLELGALLDAKAAHPVKRSRL